MATVLTGGRFLAAASLVIVFMMPGNLGAQSPTLRITVAGQSILRSDIRAHAPSAVPIIKSLLKGDVVFTNFESTVIDERKGQSLKDALASPPEAIEALKALGFNLFSLSNNHSFELKVAGIQNTLEVVNRLNLAHAGIGNTIDEAAAPAYLKTPKGTVALVAMAAGGLPAGALATATQPGVNELRVEPGNKPNEVDARRILQSIREARKRADLVIVYVHNHVLDKPLQTMMLEELPERLAPPDWLKKWAHVVVDAGADIIVMDGVPLLHGVEIYHARPIFYSMSHFFHQTPPAVIMLDEPIGWESVVAYVDFQGRNLQSIQFRPIVQNKIGQGQPDMHDRHTVNLFLQTRGLPTPATGEQAHYILARLADLSRPFGTTVVVKDDIAQVKLEGAN